MAKFTIRVVLNGNPSDDDYRKLHRAMRRKGFTNLIFSTKSKKWLRLPHSEYNRSDGVAKDAVRLAAQNAASTVSHDYQVLVTESNGRTWYNLDMATMDEIKSEERS
ncbi:MAG TPA: hypothetical protein VMG59_10460 [Phycisphaerae bacterium]|nr:hypothetical protein [Phycisphaerae bacterium]